MFTGGQLHPRMENSGSGLEVRGPTNIAISTILYILLFVLQSLVIFARLKTKFYLRVNDTFILLAMVPTTFYFVATLIANDDFQWNRHMVDIPSDILSNGLKFVLTAEVMFVLACTLAKLSMMFIVRREMSCASAFWRGLAIFSIIMVSLQGMISAILVIFQCGAPGSLLNAERSVCADNAGKIVGSSAVNVLTDILVMLLTIPCVLSYRLSRKQKAIVYTLYALGLVSVGAGILRTYFLHRASQQTDLTWAFYPVWIASGIQLYLGMICTTVPSTKNFFATYAPSVFGSLSFADHDTISHHRSSMYGAASSSGEEELLDFEKSISGTSLGSGLGMDAGSGTVTIDTRGAHGLSEEDRDFIKITQQTVVQVSRVGEL